jgi:hypothetical protein
MLDAGALSDELRAFLKAARADEIDYSGDAAADEAK